MARFRPATESDVDAVIGMMRAYYAEEGDAFVDELYIAEDGRGQGLGREALALAEAYCREPGVRALHLEVERHREPARELYRRAGFQDRDRQLMTKWLAEPAPRPEGPGCAETCLDPRHRRVSGRGWRCTPPPRPRVSGPETHYAAKGWRRKREMIMKAEVVRFRAAPRATIRASP